MPLTRDFKETVLIRVRKDRAFRRELLREGIECLVSGDLETAKSILRDYIKATVGYAQLAQATAIPEKSLLRMFGPSGNPQARNLLQVIAYLQKQEGLRLRVKQHKAA
ncbi:MAG: transcriptional regulator [Silvibacterium sp.]